MTYKEALEWCVMFENNVITNGKNDERYYQALQAMQKCKEALAKEISHKLYGKHTNHRCSVCGRRVRSGLGSSSLTRDARCQKCGTLLDWSDAE